MGSLMAAEAVSETLVATALGPVTVVDLAATPAPEPALPAAEDLAYSAPASFNIPRPVPVFRPSPRGGKALFDANLVAMIGLNVADYVSTREALKYPGLEEANPLMKPFVKSPAAFAAVKIGMTGLTYWSMKALFKKNKTMAWVMTTATNVLLSCVVANNMRQIRQARAL